MKLQAHRSGKFDDSDFLWHGLAFEIRILSPLHHSSFSPWFSSLSLNLCLARAHRGSYRYVLLGDLIGLDLSTKYTLPVFYHFGAQVFVLRPSNPPCLRVQANI